MRKVLGLLVVVALLAFTPSGALASAVAPYALIDVGTIGGPHAELNGPAIRITSQRDYFFHPTRVRARGVSPSIRQEPSFLAFSRRGDVGSALIGAAPVGNGPSTVAVDVATHTIYVANGFDLNGPFIGGNTVSVIDAPPVQRARRLALQGAVADGDRRERPEHDRDRSGDRHGAMSPTTATTRSRFSTAPSATRRSRQVAGRRPATVPVGSGPIGIFADHANHTVYVGNFNDGTVSMIDSATCNATNLAGCPTNAPSTVTVGGGTRRRGREPKNPYRLRRQPDRHSRYSTPTPATRPNYRGAGPSEKPRRRPATAAFSRGVAPSRPRSTRRTTPSTNPTAPPQCSRSTDEPATPAT